MSGWVLILGCATGHGGATAKKLAEQGYGIVGFHFDRGEHKKEAEKRKETSQPSISDESGVRYVGQRESEGRAEKRAGGPPEA